MAALEFWRAYASANRDEYVMHHSQSEIRSAAKNVRDSWRAMDRSVQGLRFIHPGDKRHAELADSYAKHFALLTAFFYPEPGSKAVTAHELFKSPRGWDTVRPKKPVVGAEFRAVIVAFANGAAGLDEAIREEFKIRTLYSF
ncbi:MAG: hypothetical protein ABIT36_06235 [Steroidobacteraceae bacterium]